MCLTFLFFLKGDKQVDLINDPMQDRLLQTRDESYPFFLLLAQKDCLVQTMNRSWTLPLVLVLSLQTSTILVSMLTYKWLPIWLLLRFDYNAIKSTKLIVVKSDFSLRELNKCALTKPWISSPYVFFFLNTCQNVCFVLDGHDFWRCYMWTIWVEGFSIQGQQGTCFWSTVGLTAADVSLASTWKLCGIMYV